MDITQIIVSGRSKAKLEGDHAAYRAHLSSRIQNLRRRLGIATKPRAKYTSKQTISQKQLEGNNDYVVLLLLTAERAWAHAVSMRVSHATEKRGITSSTRSHIISRLRKAATYATRLHDLLINGSIPMNSLEARAYVASLKGLIEFEKQSWESCVKYYAEARVIYGALATTTRNEIFRDLLSDPIDPSIRYGAFQIGIPRTTAVETIVQQTMAADSGLVNEVESLDPYAFKGQPANANSLISELEVVPSVITWRSRRVSLEDAATATALAVVGIAVKKLKVTLASDPSARLKDKASAYDSILIASQDAVDASKSAIDELVAEGVSQGDKRIQSLQITRTAVTYEMVSWRIGRNRVLLGDRDGIMEASTANQPNTRSSQQDTSKRRSASRGLTKLKENSLLYDAILQSLNTVKELPGIAADVTFVEELEAKYQYFEALNSLTVARSYAVIAQPAMSLALFDHASEKCTIAIEKLPKATEPPVAAPPSIAITLDEIKFLQEYLKAEVQRYRALVELANLTTSSHGEEEQNCFLVDRLHDYPEKDLDLQRLVSYPPRLEAAPIKPLFFDAAWNYIRYPERDPIRAVNSDQADASESTKQTIQHQKGWFGFAR